MMGAAVAYNLKKWLQYSDRKTKTAVMALKKTAESYCFLFLTLWSLTAMLKRKSTLHSYIY
jgi:hypothetical protein